MFAKCFSKHLHNNKEYELLYACVHVIVIPKGIVNFISDFDAIVTLFILNIYKTY